MIKVSILCSLNATGGSGKQHYVTNRRTITPVQKVPTKPVGMRQSPLYDEQNRSIYNELIRRGRASVGRTGRRAQDSPRSESLQPIAEQSREMCFDTDKVASSTPNEPEIDARILFSEPAISLSN